MGKKVKMQGSERSRDDVDSVEFWFGWLMASSLFLSSKSRGLRAESQTTRTKTRTMIILTHKKCPGKWANGDGGVRRPLMRHIFMYLEVILSHPVRPPPLTSLTYKYYIFQRVIHGIKGKCLSVVHNVWKSQKKSFNNASDASYVYILSDQKFIKNDKNSQLASQACSQTVLPVPDMSVLK